jgi:hypothetical protein
MTATAKAAQVSFVPEIKSAPSQDRLMAGNGARRAMAICRTCIAAPTHAEYDPSPKHRDKQKLQDAYRAAHDEVSVFIDIIGMPLTPMSFAVAGR